MSEETDTIDEWLASGGDGPEIDEDKGVDMSTNIYWHAEPLRLPTGRRVRVNDDALHICKFSGKYTLWAENPADVIKACQELSRFHIIEDEYGCLITGEEFLEMIHQDVDSWDTSYVGRVFC